MLTMFFLQIERITIDSWNLVLPYMRPVSARRKRAPPFACFFAFHSFRFCQGLLLHTSLTLFYRLPTHSCDATSPSTIQLRSVAR